MGGNISEEPANFIVPIAASSPPPPPPSSSSSSSLAKQPFLSHSLP
jgi:hypothetical protein